ncbi:glycosyl hydrolase family 18 protein [soil metagenome]
MATQNTNKLLQIILFFIFASYCQISLAMENLFYIPRCQDTGQIQPALISLQKNYKAIHILVPQAYQVDAKGLVWGCVTPSIMNFAKAHNIKIMPMITNSGFNKLKTHKFLTDSHAQDLAIQFIVNICKQNQYYGVQFDFEMIGLSHRAALTRFYQKAAAALHKNGYKISIAVAPVVAEFFKESAFLQRAFDSWQGAYDLAVLGHIADFISVMAYNQHVEGTTPGPIATAPWVEAVIKNMLRYIPAAKFSLGIATYSDYWYMGRASSHSSAVRLKTKDVTYHEVEKLLQQYHLALQWDPVSQVHYAIYQRHWLNEFIYVADAASFKSVYDLAKKYHLRGISVFTLGWEDPKIWGVLS